MNTVLISLLLYCLLTVKLKRGMSYELDFFYVFILALCRFPKSCNFWLDYLPLGNIRLGIKMIFLLSAEMVFLSRIHWHYIYYFNLTNSVKCGGSGLCFCSSCMLHVDIICVSIFLNEKDLFSLHSLPFYQISHWINNFNVFFWLANYLLLSSTGEKVIIWIFTKVF